MNMYQKREERKNKRETDNNFASVSISWYPGHMSKTKRLICDNMSLVDVVYELIDARIPYSSKINGVEDILKKKKVILVMTKYDLCDKNETDKWIKYYESIGYKVVILNLKNNKDYNKLISVTNEIMQPYIDKLANQGQTKKYINALVIGIPNVGKSTLINAIANKKVANVGNMPGVTKNINWLNTSSNIKVMDTPGILWPKLEEIVALNLAATGAIKSEILPLEQIAIYVLNFLNEYYHELLVSRYKINNVDDLEEAFDTIGKNIGAFKNGEADYTRVSITILNDIKNELVKGITFDRK